MKEPALAAKLIWKRRRQWLATILRKAPFRRCGARWPLSGHVAIRASPAGALATRRKSYLVKARRSRGCDPRAGMGGSPQGRLTPSKMPMKVGCFWRLVAVQRLHE